MSSRKTQREQIRSLLGEADATANEKERDKACEGNQLNADTIINFGTIVVGPNSGPDDDGSTQPGCSGFEDHSNGSNEEPFNSQNKRPNGPDQAVFANQDDGNQVRDRPASSAVAVDYYDPFTAGVLARYFRMRFLGVDRTHAVLASIRSVCWNSFNVLSALILFPFLAREMKGEIAPYAFKGLLLAFALIAGPTLAIESGCSGGFVSSVPANSHYFPPSQSSCPLTGENGVLVSKW